MSMKAMYDLREMLCKELDEIVRKGELGAGDLEIVHKLVSTIKNIDKIEMMESEGGYSGGGDWSADMRGTYGRGSSYRGHHRDSMGRYSRADANEQMRGKLEEMMHDADDDRVRDALRRAVDAMRG